MSRYLVTHSLRKKATQHVFIAVPTYGGLSSAWNHAKDAAKDFLIAKDISVTMAVLEGNCHVDDARNDMVRMFLESEATHLFFWDADVIASASSIHQLLQHDKDVIGGVYPYKEDDPGFPVILHGDEIQMEGTVAINLRGIPGGFMLLRRHVVQRAYEEASERGKWAPNGDYGSTPLAEVFRRKINRFDEPRGGFTAERLSGDYQFCQDLQSYGFVINADPNLTLGHEGIKVWYGNVGRWWLERSGKLGEMTRMALGAIHDSSNSPEIRARGFGRLADLFGNKPYAAGPGLLEALFLHATSPEVKNILELGTGVSTALMASIPGRKLVSLESEVVWGSATERFLTDAGLDPTAIRYAPIVGYPSGPWFDFKDNGFAPDLIFVDGPRRTGFGVRAQLFEVLPRMVQRAKFIIIDDADDKDGQYTMQKASEAGFDMAVIPNPRRDFAIGVK